MLKLMTDIETHNIISTPSPQGRHWTSLDIQSAPGADKYIFEAFALGQVAQQNLLALPSNLLALL